VKDFSELKKKNQKRDLASYVRQLEEEDGEYGLGGN